MTIIHVHGNIILDFPITYKNASVLCQSECASCLHQTVNIVVFFLKNNENNPKGRALISTNMLLARTNLGTKRHQHWRQTSSKHFNDIFPYYMYILDGKENYKNLIWVGVEDWIVQPLGQQGRLEPSLCSGPLASPAVPQSLIHIHVRFN